MRSTRLLPLISLLLFATSASAAPATETIQGAGWSAGFRAGVLVELRNLLTGETLVAPEEKAPLTGLRFDRQKLLATEADTDPDRRGEPRVRPGRLEVAWPDGARLVQTTAAGPDALVVRQEASVGAPPLVGAQWGIASVPADVEVLVPGHSGLRFGPGAPDGNWSFEYPISWEAQFVLIQGRKGGFLLWTDDTEYRYKTLWVQRRGGRTSLALETRATAPFAAVKDLKSVAWRVQPYKGSWLDGAAIYRSWAERAFDLKAIRAGRPKWAERIRAVFIVPMEMELLDELAKRVKPDETLLYVPNWRRDGYDRNYPDYTADEKFGPWNERAHALGFRVMPHVNYFGCDPLHPLYEEFKAQHMRDPFSDGHLWWDWDRAVPPIKFAYINPASRAWRRLFVARMKDLCTKYRIDALHLDQTLCIFNDNNGAIDGMSCMQGNLELHKELREALPNVALSGEGLNEITYRYEELTQRHLYGLNHADATWNDTYIRLAHPVSSSLLTPHTAVYGYLGMSNPFSGALYHAWRRGYDHFGVIPTLSHVGTHQLREGADTLGSFFAEASFFQQTQAVPDFTPPWPEGALFQYRLSDGGRAVLRRDNGVVLEAMRPGGRKEEIYRRIEGVATAALPGSISGWRAYDERQLIGLDPAQSYTYSNRPRDPKAFHITALPEGAVVRRAGVRDGLASIRLEDARAEVARLWEPGTPVEGGVKLTDGVERRYPLLYFSDESGGNSTGEGDGVFLHPPWRVTERDPQTGINLAKGIGVSFLEYTLSLPNTPEIRFDAGVHLRKGAVGKSDGATFRVEVRAGAEAPLRAEAHHDGEAPAPLTLDLSPLRGRKVTLRLETDPGPQGSATFDWAVIDRPRVVATDRTPRQVVLYSPKPITAAIGPEGDLPLNPLGGQRWEARAGIPGAFFLAFEPAPVATLPLSVAEARGSAALVYPDGTEQAPGGFCQMHPIEAAVAGEKRKGISTHPPNRGQMVVDYVVRLPAGPARFEGAAGIRDGAISKGVGFIVRVNGGDVWSASMLPEQPWKPFAIDLAKYAGKTIVISLVADSQGAYDFDWAVWGEPRIVRP